MWRHRLNHTSKRLLRHRLRQLQASQLVLLQDQRQWLTYPWSNVEIRSTCRECISRALLVFASHDLVVLNNGLSHILLLVITHTISRMQYMYSIMPNVYSFADSIICEYINVVGLCLPIYTIARVVSYRRRLLPVCLCGTV